MKSAAHYLPPLCVIAALVLQSASGGFPVISLLFSPAVLIIGLVMVALLLARNATEQTIRECVRSFAVWLAFALLAGYVWMAGSASGHFERHMLPEFLGLASVMHAAWFKVLAVGLSATLCALFLRSPWTRLSLVAALLLVVGGGLFVADLVLGSRHVVNLTPGRQLTSVRTPEGEVIHLPFKLLVTGIRPCSQDHPSLLRVTDNKGRISRELPLLRPVKLGIAGDYFITAREKRPVTNRIVDANLRSGEYKAPAVVVREVSAEGVEISRFVLFGYEGSTNSAWLSSAKMPVHFRFYGDKADTTQLTPTNLPWLPFLVARIGDKSYSIPCSTGRKTDIPNSHYSIRILSVSAGDMITGSRGKVEFAFLGPHGESKFALGEGDVAATVGTSTPPFSALLVHPVTEGESDSFVRVLGGDGFNPYVTVIRNGVVESSHKLDSQVSIKLGSSKVLISTIVPDAELVEGLVASEDGCPAIAFVRTGNDAEEKQVVVSPQQQFPTELVREGRRIALRPITSSVVGFVQAEVEEREKPVRKTEITGARPEHLDGWAVSVLGIDRMQSAYVTLGLSKNYFGWLPFVLVLAGVLLFAVRVAFFAYIANRAGEHSHGGSQ